ncbi:Uma2 family endonuclease [Tautonia sociabilis]|nr:Uma2 family endonuclease [Tautonia sociabilis]
MSVASPLRRDLSAPERSILLDGISRDTYAAILRDFEDRQTFLTYDRGRLEIISPSFRHEVYGTLIGVMIGILAEEIGLAVKTGRSTTLRKQGLEMGRQPDECFWIADEPRLRGRSDHDPEVDPPPDLAIEVEVSHRALNRLGIYAALGVPEIWRCDGRRLLIGVRQDDGSSAWVDRSPWLPMRPPEVVIEFLRRYETRSETDWRRAFREWVRAEALPRPDPPREEA